MPPPRGSRSRRSQSVTPPPVSTETLDAWFTAALPDGWFRGAPRVRHDDDEILVTGDLGPPGAGLSHDQQIVAFREATREQRMSIADAAQAEFRRTVSWGVECGQTEVRFTTVNAPAMTRLRLEERQVLDTLIDGGIARSRSEALAWCVRLVGEHEDDWISELREAVARVQEVRDQRT
ncbi:MAG: hypothetical protein DHS20C19_23440 [Acidimicrobiales bacterium]|nr:MAG: hypothetical protein DHS20C19_23440 [Acidimicrobiales bacterium]